jgi:tetratricopeptide (TPR) repeat protein
MDRWGLDTLHGWYRGEPIEGLTHQRWDSLERAFQEWLATQPLPSTAADYARSRFERPSVWRRKCPHVVDALDRAADRCRDEHRLQRAVHLYESALERDPEDWRARFGRAWLLVHEGQAASGLEALTNIERDSKAPRAWRDRAEEARADDAWIHGRRAEAEEMYRFIAASTTNEDFARTLEVKALGTGSVEGGGAILDLLVREPGRSQDPWLGAVSTAEWAARTRDPLAEYLLGKNLLAQGEWDRAAEHLDRALSGAAPTVRVGREMLRARIICACALGDQKALEPGRSAVISASSPFAGGAGGRRDWVLRLVDRCRERTGAQ